MSLTQDDLKAIGSVVEETIEPLKKDNRRNGALLEDIHDKFDGLIDGIASIHEQLDRVPKREEFNDLRADVKTIKLVVMNHEDRLKTLEAI